MLKRLFSLFLALFMGVWNFIAICYGVGVAWGPKIDLDKFALTFEDTFDGEQLDSTKWTTKNIGTTTMTISARAASGTPSRSQ